MSCFHMGNVLIGQDCKKTQRLENIQKNMKARSIQEKNEYLIYEAVSFCHSVKSVGNLSFCWNYAKILQNKNNYWHFSKNY